MCTEEDVLRVIQYKFTETGMKLTEDKGRIVEGEIADWETRWRTSGGAFISFFTVSS